MIIAVGCAKSVYTIGVAGKSAETFFELLRRNGIRRLVDVRLHNTSQLAGFTKRDDLRYFLKEICGIEYLHELRLAPTEELIEEYKNKAIDWSGYESRFSALMAQRDPDVSIERRVVEEPTVLLCSEPTANRCHRRLVGERLASKWGLQVIHL